MRASQGLSEDLQRREPVVCGARSVVQAVGDAVKIVLTYYKTLRSVPLGRYWRSSPLVFSQVPRSHGLCGSQKYTATPVRAVRPYVATVPCPWSQVRLWRIGAAIEFSLALNPTSACFAVTNSEP